MGIKDFVKKIAKDVKESQKPENVEKRLMAQIKKEELKNKLDKIKEERRKRKEKGRKELRIGI